MNRILAPNWKQQRRKVEGALLGASSLFAVLACLALALASAPASAQNGQQQDSVGEDAVDAVTQPLSDLGLRSKDIPEILLTAQEAPYDLSGVADCPSLRGEIARLEEVLGPDADAPQEERGIVNRVLGVGGDVLGGMIPFRGIVRRLSGAHADEKELEAAVYAGVARRSYLKGYLAGQSCPTSEEISVRSARDLLGLSETGLAEEGR